MENKKIVKRYLEENQKALDVWRVLERLLKSHNKKDFDIIKKYQEYYNDLEKKLGKKVLKELSQPSNLRIFKPKVFADTVRRLNPELRRAQTFSVDTNEPLYIILIGFIAGFNASETNEMLNSAGFEKLHGRSVLHCAYIYCLNSKKTYDDCILNIHPKLEKLIGSDIQHSDKIRTWNDLEEYVEGSFKMKYMTTPVQMIKLTADMTTEIMKISEYDKLEEYVKINREKFKIFRESPRRMLCAKLYELAKSDEEKYISADVSESENKGELGLLDLRLSQTNSFKRDIQRIWEKDFYEYYHFYTKISIISSTLYDAQQATKDYEKREVIENKNYLYNFIKGERQINRKILIMFMLYIQYYELIDDICIACGMQVPTRENIFDKAVDELCICQSSDTDEYVDFDYIQVVFYELYAVKTYCLYKYLADRTTLKKYKDIAESFAEKIARISKINKANLRFITKAELIYTALDTIHQVENEIDTEPYLQTLGDIIANIESSKASEIRRRCDEIIQDENILQKKPRQNKHFNKILENPFYLNPKIDL